MGRTSTAALFVPICESLLLSLICCFLLHAFFSVIVPADYAPATRSAITVTIIINIITTAAHVAIAAAYRTSHILSRKPSKADDNDEKKRQQTSVATSKMTYHHTLGTANAHCCASCALFVLQLLLFLQVAAFPDQLQPSVNLSRGSQYVSTTQLNDWRQAIVGSSGEWQPVPGVKNAYSASPVSGLPIAGSLYNGILLALLLVLFFVSIYAAFMATPHEATTLMFFDPRFMILLNVLLVMVASYSVKHGFVYCYCGKACLSSTALCILFALFTVLACWLDLLVALAVPTRFIYGISKLVILAVLALLPAFASVIIQGVPPMFKVFSWVLAVISVLGMGIDFWIHQYTEPKKIQEDVVVEDVPSAEIKPIDMVERSSAEPSAPPEQSSTRPSVAAAGSSSSWIIPMQKSFYTQGNNKQHFA